MKTQETAQGVGKYAASHKAVEFINRSDCQLTVAHGMIHGLVRSTDKGMMSEPWLLQVSASCMV